MEIIPHIGIGPLRFGLKRDQVLAILGAKQTWEQWMGGNLNDSLFYPGIILYFDKYDSYGPLAEGKLIQIEVSSEYPCSFCGHKLSELTREAIVSGVSATDWKHFPKGSIESAELEMQFWFKPSGSLRNLRLSSGVDAQQGAQDRRAGDSARLS